MEELLQDFGKAVVRTPLFSWHVLFNEDGSTCDIEELLWKYLDNPFFLEGLYWSSPLLFTQVQKLKEGNIKESKKYTVLHTLKKYLIRACTRPTPYGIFAGSCIISFDNSEPQEHPAMERKVRIDSSLMFNICSRMEADPAIYPDLLYTVNNTLYSIPGQFRFTETIVENGKWRYQLSSVIHTSLLQKIYSLAWQKKLSITEIYEQSATCAPFEVFRSFLEKLVQSQFLVSELMESPTVGDELARYISILQRVKKSGNREVQKYLTLLLSLESVIANLQKLPAGNLPFKEIEDLKRQLNEREIATFHEHLFHIDLKKDTPGHSVLSNEKVREIKEGIKVLGKVSGNSDLFDNRMMNFKKLFLEKYGTRQIPLCEALDPDFGIGFPPPEKIGDTAFNPIIDKIDTTGKKAGRSKQSLLPGKSERLYENATKEEIRIEDHELLDLEDQIYRLPNVFSAMGILLPSRKILLEGVGKAHANALLGRFANLDSRIYDLCKTLAKTEEQNNEEVLLAEIVFQPGGRIGNIARRPAFFEYEIPFLSSPGVEGKQVPVQDLQLSVSGDELVLWSKKFEKRVIPRLSNAHNYTQSSLPIYQFLGSLQYLKQSSFEIDRVDFPSSKRFLPRITYKNIILRRACWFFSIKDIEVILEAPDQVEYLRSCLLKRNVSKLVSIAEGDNELFIDTVNTKYLELLVREMESHHPLKLIEWPFGSPPEGTSADMETVEQFILPLAQKNRRPFAPSRIIVKNKDIKDKFEPGTEWVYFKMYCGASFSDRILIDVVKPSVELLLKDGIIQKAFFIRYTDPHYHIRFRLHLNDDPAKELLSRVLKCVYSKVQALLTTDILWKLQLDTYHRETERYGAKEILKSEVVFFYDSLLYLNCLKNELLIGDDEMRFLAAIKNLDKWLILFGLNLEEKSVYCQMICDRLANEFGRKVKFQVDRKYRELGKRAVTFLESSDFST